MSARQRPVDTRFPKRMLETMNMIWDFIQYQLAHNQLFGGGLILMVGGALLAYFREVPSRIWQWLRRRWLIEIDILDRDPAFEWIDKWLSQHS